jgi:16S rRNA (guanine527-N7)-methyltransferase
VPEVDVPEPLVPAARVLFAQRLPLARRYADLLATEGVVRGLIGPREAPRIWDRHLLNCAAVAEIMPNRASVVDVGSGAGLPGLALAVARPDLVVVLVDSLARRTTFLAEAVAALDLAGQVSVVRGRAEELAAELAPADVVTARAVAPLDRLAAWCLPLTAAGGRLLAIKGVGAAEEAAAHRAAIARLGGGTPTVRLCGVGLLEEPTTVVEIVRERLPAPATRVPRRRTR